MIDSGINKKKRIENKVAYLFDFDGVIVDSFGHHLNHMKAVCFEFKKDDFIKVLKEYLSSVGKSINDFDSNLDAYRYLWSVPGHFSVHYKNLGINYDENKQLIREFFKDFINPDSLRFFKGMPELLNDLRSAGYKTGLVTGNFRETVQKFLEKNNIVFDCVFCSEDVDKGKPGPDGLEKCLEALNYKASQAVFIGDAIFDAQAAEAAGIDFIGVSYGYTLPGVLEQYPNIAIVDSPETLKNTLLPLY